MTKWKPDPRDPRIFLIINRVTITRTLHFLFYLHFTINCLDPSIYQLHIFFSQEWWWKENVFWTYSGRTSGKSKVLCFLLWRPGTETWTCSTFHFIYLQKFSSTIFQFKLPTLNMNLMEHIRLNVKTKLNLVKMTKS